MPKKEAVKKMLNNADKGTVETKRKIKTIICKNCGSEHDANFIKCPNCGYNRFFNVLKTFMISLIVSFVTFSSIYSIIKLNQISDAIEALNLQVNANTSDSQTETYDISQASYYNDLLLTGDVDLNSLGDDYILYFHQDGCQYCMEANVYIDIYIANKFNETVPIYFVTPASSVSLFNDKLFGEYKTEDGTTMYGVESTPTFVRMNKNKIVDKQVGAEQGFTLLDEVVKEIKGE